MIAAILTLTEGRPGIREFWEDVRDGVEGWPSLLPQATTLLLAAKEGKDVIRRAELALYAAFAYCEHKSYRNASPESLLTKREVFEPYRAEALEASFMGPTHFRMPQKRKVIEGRSIRVQTATGWITVVKVEHGVFSAVARMLGVAGARELAKAAARTYQAEKERYSLTTVVQEELKAFVRENLKAAQFLGIENLERFFEPPRARGGTAQRKQGKSSANSCDHRAHVIVRIKAEDVFTTISIRRGLFDKAVTLLGCARVAKAELRKAFAQSPPSGRGERSRRAREQFLESLCLHPKVEQVRLP